MCLCLNFLFKTQSFISTNIGNRYADINISVMILANQLQKKLDTMSAETKYSMFTMSFILLLIGAPRDLTHSRAPKTYIIYIYYCCDVRRHQCTFKNESIRIYLQLFNTCDVFWTHSLNYMNIKQMNHFYNIRLDDFLLIKAVLQ